MFLCYILHGEASIFYGEALNFCRDVLNLCGEASYLCGEASYLHRATDFAQNNDRFVRKTVGSARSRSFTTEQRHICTEKACPLWATVLLACATCLHLEPLHFAPKLVEFLHASLYHSSVLNELTLDLSLYGWKILVGDTT